MAGSLLELCFLAFMSFLNKKGEERNWSADSQGFYDNLNNGCLGFQRE
jgi:hypothetical protein